VRIEVGIASKIEIDYPCRGPPVTSRDPLRLQGS
jgi:hypothetical protein